MNYVKVEFLNEWMGNPKGSKLVILDRVALELENRGTIKILIDKEKIKGMDNPPNNKMIESSSKKEKKK